jgi:hypothetical protein
VREIRKCSKYCPRRNLRGRKYPTADHVSIKLWGEPGTSTDGFQAPGIIALLIDWTWWRCKSAWVLREVCTASGKITRVMSGLDKIMRLQKYWIMDAVSNFPVSATFHPVSKWLLSLWYPNCMWVTIHLLVVALNSLFYKL